MIELKKPMLAAKYDPAKAVFPMLGSIKVDGVRCLIREGVALSRALKPIPNEYVQAWAAIHDSELHGLDGELVLGDMTAKDCFRKTTSAVMSRDGEPEFTFWTFDMWDRPDVPYLDRMVAASLRDGVDKVRLLENTWLHDQEKIDEFSREHEEAGHEGIMLRDPHGLYKMGRATVKQRQLLKLKSFVDAEAVIIGIEEEMHNANEATTNEVGATQRSLHKENLVGKGTMGALKVCLRDDPSVEFHIGTGFSAQERQEIWDEQPLSAVVKFKYFETGSKDKPRFPVFLGFRSEDDL